MGTKKEKKVERIEAAKEFARFSGQIADGFLQVEEKEVELPEQFILKKALKIKKSEITFELSIKIKKAKENEKAEERQKKEARKKDSKRPYKAKRLKKEIGMLWKAFKRCVKNGESFRDTGLLIKDLGLYGQMADSEWASQWQECEELVKEAVDLVDKGKREDALQLCNKVDQLTKACHKRFK